MVSCQISAEVWSRLSETSGLLSAGKAGECKPALSWLCPDKVALGQGKNHLHLGCCMLEAQGANLRNTSLYCACDFCRENKSSQFLQSRAQEGDSRRGGAGGVAAVPKISRLKGSVVTSPLWPQLRHTCPFP